MIDTIQRAYRRERGTAPRKPSLGRYLAESVSGPLVVKTNGKWEVNGFELCAGDPIAIRYGRFWKRGYLRFNGTEFIFVCGTQVFRSSCVEGLLCRRSN